MCETPIFISDYTSPLLIFAIMPSPGLSYQAVVLAGGDDKRLYPLGGVKALLPVANRPLLSYPLRTLSDAGLKHALVVSSVDFPMHGSE